MKWLGIPIEFYALCWAGALGLYFKLKTDRKPVIQFLTHIHPALAKTTTGRVLDAFLFALFGALVATLCTQPTNPQQALVAGLGWTGFLSALSRHSAHEG